MISSSRLSQELKALVDDGGMRSSKADEIARLIVSNFEEMEQEIRDLASTIDDLERQVRHLER